MRGKKRYRRRTTFRSFKDTKVYRGVRDTQRERGKETGANREEDRGKKERRRGRRVDSEANVSTTIREDGGKRRCRRRIEVGRKRKERK